MAVKKHAAKTTPGKGIKNALLEKAAELWEAHAGEIMELVEESEEHKLTVGFSLEIDCSESAPNVTVKIRFASTVTDSRKVQMDDPNQTQFTDVVQHADKEREKKRGKKDKEPEPASETEAK